MCTYVVYIKPRRETSLGEKYCSEIGYCIDYLRAVMEDRTLHCQTFAIEER